MASVHLNLSHVYTLTHLCREELIRNQGAIINVSSKVATTGQGQTSSYAAAKGAMNALTREWAIAFARKCDSPFAGECVHGSLGGGVA